MTQSYTNCLETHHSQLRSQNCFSNINIDHAHMINYWHLRHHSEVSLPYASCTSLPGVQLLLDAIGHKYHVLSYSEWMEKCNKVARNDIMQLCISLYIFSTCSHTICQKYWRGDCSTHCTKALQVMPSLLCNNKLSLTKNHFQKSKTARKLCCGLLCMICTK